MPSLKHPAPPSESTLSCHFSGVEHLLELFDKSMQRLKMKWSFGPKSIKSLKIIFMHAPWGEGGAGSFLFPSRYSCNCHMSQVIARSWPT